MWQIGGFVNFLLRTRVAAQIALIANIGLPAGALRATEVQTAEGGPGQR